MPQVWAEQLAVTSSFTNHVLGEDRGAEVAALGAAAAFNLAVHARRKEHASTHWLEMGRYVDGMKVCISPRSPPISTDLHRSPPIAADRR